MGNRRKQGQWLSQRVARHRIRSILVLLGTFCCLSIIQTATAKTTVIRYLNVNSYVIPFETLVAPLTLVTVTAGTSMKYNAEVSTAHISWSAVADTDQYKLMLYDAASNQWNLIYDGPGQYFEIDDLSLGAHYFSVIACGGGMCGDYSPNAGLVIETNLDKDLDGVDDENDLCLGTVEGATVSAAGCIPTMVDTDGDGVTDDLDWCAATVAGESVDSRGCAPDQIDSDDDGIPDYQDAYPLQSATQCTGG